jgi:hypothetical protein
VVRSNSAYPPGASCAFPVAVTTLPPGFPESAPVAPEPSASFHQLTGPAATVTGLLTVVDPAWSDAVTVTV